MFKDAKFTTGTRVRWRSSGFVFSARVPPGILGHTVTPRGSRRPVKHGWRWLHQLPGRVLGISREGGSARWSAASVYSLMPQCLCDRSCAQRWSMACYQGKLKSRQYRRIRYFGGCDTVRRRASTASCRATARGRAVARHDAVAAGRWARDPCSSRAVGAGSLVKNASPGWSRDCAKWITFTRGSL